MEVHFDYCFMSTHGSPLATILVAKEKSSRMTLATMVPMKGASVEYPVRRTLTFLKEVGLEGADIVFKSDQGPALNDLINTIAARRAATSKIEKFDDEEAPAGGDDRAVGRTIHESSPVGSSQSNGLIERAIQDAEGQIRTMKLDFESHLGEQILSDHNLIPWLVEYAAVLLNRGQVGQDGKTAYERLKGKAASVPGMQFGERLLWRTNIPARDRRNRMVTQTSEGIYLGQRTVSGECLVGSAEGVCRPRTVYSVPLENRWKENLSLEKGLPWKPNAEHEGGEEVVLDAYMPEPSPTPTGSPLPPVTLDEKLKKAKTFYVKQKDLDPALSGLAWTHGCKGCESIAGKYATQLAQQ